jgi:hypothetical protein
MKINAITYILSVFMIVMALVLAGYLAFTELIDTLYGWKRTTLEAVLVAYSAYRAYRLYLDIKSNKSE